MLPGRDMCSQMLCMALLYGIDLSSSLITRGLHPKSSQTSSYTTDTACLFFFLSKVRIHFGHGGLFPLCCTLPSASLFSARSFFMCVSLSLLRAKSGYGAMLYYFCCWHLFLGFVVVVRWARRRDAAFCKV